MKETYEEKAVSYYPPISARTLFHFTKKRENLISILENEFRPHYCLEYLGEIGSDENRTDLDIAVPMVCFCDLPLSQISYHLSAYGEYGIGMTKEWAIKNGISPVIYTYRTSLLASRLRDVMGLSLDPTFARTTRDSMHQNLFDFSCFIKPYIGDLWRKDEIKHNVCFYNEREWRFVSAAAEEAYSGGMSKESFLDETTRIAANERVFEFSRISFEPEDIRYLIVQHEDEIVPLVNQIKVIKGKNYEEDDVTLLASRIIVADQIRTDF